VDVLVGDVLRDLGGVARRASLLKQVDRKDLDRAVLAGDIARDARGLYSLPDADEGLRLASKYGGVLALTSAALRHGWAVKTVPDKPHIMVSRGRKLRGQASDVHIHFAELASADVCDQVTTEPVTLAHCLRRLPFADALAVADSALREGFGRQSLCNLTDSMRGPGSRQAQRVAVLASPRVANPFESGLHAIAEGVPGLHVRPQVRIDDAALVVRPDPGPGVRRTAEGTP
jgi:hypothetical protein